MVITHSCTSVSGSTLSHNLPPAPSHLPRTMACLNEDEIQRREDTLSKRWEAGSDDDTSVVRQWLLIWMSINPTRSVPFHTPCPRGLCQDPPPPHTHTQGPVPAAFRRRVYCWRMLAKLIDTWIGCSLSFLYFCSQGSQIWAGWGDCDPGCSSY